MANREHDIQTGEAGAPNQKSSDGHAASPPLTGRIDVLGGIKCFFRNVAAIGREKREAKAWVKSLSEDYIADLVGRVLLPEGAFDEREHRYFDYALAKEAAKIYRAYVETNMAEQPELHRKLLARELYLRRKRQWSDATVDRRAADWQRQYAAEEAAKAAAFDARRAAARAQPDRMSVEGMRAEAERSFAATGIYALSTGRILTPAERFQLGLPSGHG